VGAQAAATDRIVTRHKVTFVMTLPYRYVEDVRSVQGVREATFATWVGAKSPQHETEFFATLAVDPESFFDVYTEMAVPKEQLAAFQQDRQGAIVGDVLAAKLGWKVGDRVVLESSIYPSPPDSPWTVTISGIYVATQKSVDRSTFVFHWQYLNDRLPEIRKDQIGWVVSRVENPGAAAETARRIDTVFDERDIQTLSQDERAFTAGFLGAFSAVLRALDAISVAILFVMVMILGNTIAMGVRERTNEYGVLRAIGFAPLHIAIFIVGEGLLVGALGGAVGLAISYPIVQQGIGGWIEENMGAMFPYFRIEVGTAMIAFLLAVGLGLAGSVVPAVGAVRLKVTDALRRVA
jgi:putative ABC transport system permease protein